MPEIHGRVEPGFEAVRDAFAKNFELYEEVGASFCLYKDGAPVVDIWGGVADKETGREWGEDAAAVVFSTTKGAVAICLHLLVQRGQISLDEPVATYWPEFAANGKAAVTVRQLASHQTGLFAIPEGLTLEDLYSWDPIVSALGDATPAWEPGTAHGYHALTYGWLVGEVVRRVSGRSIGEFFAAEVAAPLSLDFWIGLPAAEEPRVAVLDFAPPPEQAEALAKVLGPGSPFWLASGRGLLGQPSYNTRELRAAQVPGAGGVGTARSLARMYAATIGEVDGVRLLERASVDVARTEVSAGADQVLAMPTNFGTGFMVPGGSFILYDEHSYGHYGAGGSVGLASPEAGLAFGYVPNRMTSSLIGDPRTQSLFAAVRSSQQ
ncbi:MAG: serine hydrolase domain-containing protein [Cumulibacter sp.]